MVNFSYEPPKLSGLLPNPVVRWVFDGWMLSGIGQWVSGTPNGISLTTTDGADPPVAATVSVSMSSATPRRAAPLFYQWFNTAAFGRPGKGDSGNAARVNIRNPGVNNLDLALSKRFLLRSEKRFLQFRWEAYNTFNHTQYSGLNTTARFDPAGARRIFCSGR